MARPTDYTPELADIICGRLSAGESMHSICKDDDFPSRQTLFTWMRVHPAFLDQYARAKEESGDAYADKIAHVADGALSGEYDPNAARVAIDGYKWTAVKMKPKKYGERQHVEHSGNVSNLSDAELDAMIAKMKNDDAGG